MATEKRLIYLEDVLADLHEVLEAANADPDKIMRIAGACRSTLIKHFENFPTVDAVEVVRCKDCKHYDNSEGICWCHLNSKFYPGGFDWHSFPKDGYCSYGERKDNG